MSNHPTAVVQLYWLETSKRWLVTVTVPDVEATFVEYADTTASIDSAAGYVLARAVADELERWLPF